MIAMRTSHVTDDLIDEAVELFTTPMANMDGREPTSVLEDFEYYLAEARGRGGRKPDPGSIVYTLLGILVGWWLTIRASRDVSEAQAWFTLTCELSPAQRERLGMTADLSGTRFDTIAVGMSQTATDEEKEAGRLALKQEYARFSKQFGAAMETINSSPYPTSRRLTSIERQAIKEDPNHPERRISIEEQERNEARYEAVTNKVVAVPALKLPNDGFVGDLASDETIVISTKNRKGVGSRPGKWWSADPDAEYWRGKNKNKKNRKAEQNSEDPVRGFGYGITYAIRMGRISGQPVVNIPVGIHIGGPNGGRPAEFAIAEKHARLHGLTGTSKDRYAVADTGFTTKDAWVPTLIELGYKVCADYPSNYTTDREIPDVNVNGEPAPGPYISAGCIRCPGIAGFLAESPEIPARLPAPEPAENIVVRQRHIDYLEALAMPVRNGLKKLKNATRGRPRKDAAPVTDLYSITVQCPASLGMVNCPNAPRADGLTTPDVPDVLHPPFPGQPHLWPRACRQESVTYQLDEKQIKLLQAKTHGSYYQTDLYETMRSANERFHSLWKHKKAGGVYDFGWSEIRGRAKRGFLFSIATAVTSSHLIRDFNDSPQAAPPREIERRRRSKILAKFKKKATEAKTA